jgi:hypothetical protein
MNSRDFAKALQMIHDASFDDDKLRVAEQMALDNTLCIDQIMAVCRLMSFEKNKLEFAKFAYASCAEQQNYFKGTSKKFSF